MMADRDRTDTERLVAIETTVNDIKLRLLGNGQPGEIDKLHARINGIGKRVMKLENWRWWVVGIAVGLGVAMGVGLRDISEKLVGISR